MLGLTEFSTFSSDSEEGTRVAAYSANCLLVILGRMSFSGNNCGTAYTITCTASIELLLCRRSKMDLCEGK